MKISELKPGMRRVDVEGKITEKGEPRSVQTRFGETSNVADAVLADDSGSVKMSLWNEQIDSVNVGDEVRVENGYVTSFRGETQLSVGRYGRLTLKPKE
jgi:replication factor A1